MVAAKQPMVAKHEVRGGPLVPGKISEMILDFAAPIVDQLVAEKAPLKTWRESMMMVITVWNAHVMAMPLWGKPEILAELMVMVGGPTAPAGLSAVFLALSEERRTRFATVPLVIGEWSVTQLPDGGFSLRCDARLPKQV